MPTKLTSPSLHVSALLFQCLYVCFGWQAKLKQHLNIFFKRWKYESVWKCFLIISLRNSSFPSLIIVSISKKSSWHDTIPCSQRQAAVKGEIGGAGRLVYNGDIHLIFVSPCLVAAQQSHFYKAGIKWPLGPLTYPSCQEAKGSTDRV